MLLLLCIEQACPEFNFELAKEVENRLSSFRNRIALAKKCLEKLPKICRDIKCLHVDIE